nr:MAG: RNA polymerase II [Diabrotica toursvirus 3a]
MIIDQQLLNYLLDFIVYRPTIPFDAEKVIVEKKINLYSKQLLGKSINDDKISLLKQTLENHYLNSLIQPGEAVGIICGQCIGEKTTQGSLNNFHVAGLDTGATSQIDNLQMIINASKVNNRKEDSKQFLTNLYLKSRPQTVKELYEKTVGFLDEIKISDIVINYVKINDNSIILNLSLEKIFKMKITRECILNNILAAIPEIILKLEYFSSLEETAEHISLYVTHPNKNIFENLRIIKEVYLTGIKGLKQPIFLKDEQNNEWYVQCNVNTLNIFLFYGDVYDLNRIMCTSINDINSIFGILVTQQVIIKKCKEIIPDIDISHYKILAARMTKTGNIEPLTRYTMRLNNSPLTKASFEESFETFLKACKFKEKEKFQSMSSAIICGKKPRIGTYFFDILVDPNFYNLSA